MRILVAVAELENSPEESAAAEQEQIPYEWLVQAIELAGAALADDLRDVLERSLYEAPPADPLTGVRLTRLLEELQIWRGDDSSDE